MVLFSQINFLFVYSKQGAWHETIAVYTQADVADIIEYARLRQDKTKMDK